MARNNEDFQEWIWTEVKTQDMYNHYQTMEQTKKNPEKLTVVKEEAFIQIQ